VKQKRRSLEKVEMGDGRGGGSDVGKTKDGNAKPVEKRKKGKKQKMKPTEKKSKNPNCGGGRVGKRGGGCKKKKGLGKSSGITGASLG